MNENETRTRDITWAVPIIAAVLGTALGGYGASIISSRSDYVSKGEHLEFKQGLEVRFSAIEKELARLEGILEKRK